MYFIYPASVSENCDKRIVPAVAKCIERFFLMQLQDAITSGVLPLSRRFNGRNYGPILLECVKNYNDKQLLAESNILLEKRGGGGGNNHGNHFKNLIKDLDDCISLLKSTITPSQYERIVKEFNIAVQHVMQEADDMLKNQKIRQSEHMAIRREVNNRIHQFESKCNEWNRQRGKDVRDSHDREYILDKREKEAQRDREHAEDREYELEKRKREEKERKEKEAREMAQAGVGSYNPMDSKIDIIPTGGNVNVNVLYKGGTLNGKVDNVDFTINVKVIPTIIKNFKVLEKDLLDDYFSKKSESWFKSKGRNIARKSYNILKRLPFGIGDAIWKAGMTIAGEDVERESKKDVIYNTQGFVDASAFHRSGNSPNNYNYTSNIVIFNKDDLTDPDDSNIFQNRSAMVRLFKMGWSTFCMLDPVEELMYFISSLDGGFMHVVPYTYIMESYGSKAYYGKESKLKDSAKPFLIKRGNFNSFAQQFNKKRK